MRNKTRVITTGLLIAALAAVGLFWAFGAGAAPVTVTEQLGRNEKTYDHFGNPARGQYKAVVAVELVDTNADGAADGIQAACRSTKISRVLRTQVDLLRLQYRTGPGDDWHTLQTAGPRNSGAAASILVKTGIRDTAPDGPEVRYQADCVTSTRWDDGFLSRPPALVTSGLIVEDRPVLAA